jgi:hypothetical protein
LEKEPESLRDILGQTENENQTSKMEPYEIFARRINAHGEAIESLISNGRFFALVAMVALLLAMICGLFSVHLLRMLSENGE